MWLILFFRLSLLSVFLMAAWKWGDWRNWQKYYSSMLFVAFVDMSAAYIFYHHPLWIFGPDAFVHTETVVQFINTYLVLPATTLVYLSKFPSTGRGHQCAYIFMWVLIFGALEFIDHTIIGGISYGNGWSLRTSVFFDFAMFTTIRIHYTRPLLGWLAALVGAIIILAIFGGWSAEIK